MASKRNTTYRVHREAGLEQYMIRLGKHEVGSYDSETKTIFVHPEFASHSEINDIAEAVRKKFGFASNARLEVEVNEEEEF